MMSPISTLITRAASTSRVGLCASIRHLSTSATTSASRVSTTQTLNPQASSSDEPQHQQHVDGQDDPFMDVSKMSTEELDQLGSTLEQHGRSASALRLRRKYFARLPWGRLNVLEIGCGTGVVTRALASQDGVESVVGVDPSIFFLERAKVQAGNGFLCSRPDSSPVEYIQGSAFAVPKPDESFDLVVFHETLAHVPVSQLGTALAEVKRLLKPGGMVSVYDRDWLTFDCYQGKQDELRSVNEFYMNAMVQDPYLMRKMPAMLEEAGFTMKNPLQLWVDVETDKGDGYMTAWQAINYGCERGLIDESTKVRLLEDLESRSLVASVGHGHCAARKL